MPYNKVSPLLHVLSYACVEIKTAANIKNIGNFIFRFFFKTIVNFCRMKDNLGYINFDYFLMIFYLWLCNQKHFKVHLTDIIVGLAKINFDVEWVCSFNGLFVILACILSYFCQFVSTCNQGSVSKVVTNHLEVEDFRFALTSFWKSVVLYNGDELLVVY